MRNNLLHSVCNVFLVHPTGLHIFPRAHTLALQYDLVPHPSARLLLLSIEDSLGLIFLPLGILIKMRPYFITLAQWDFYVGPLLTK